MPTSVKKRRLVPGLLWSQPPEQAVQPRPYAGDALLRLLLLLLGLGLQSLEQELVRGGGRWVVVPREEAPELLLGVGKGA